MGSAAVFTAGARIAAGLVAKQPIHLIPKTGIIGGIAAGFTLTYKVIINTYPIPSPGKSILETGEIRLEIKNLKLNSSQDSEFNSNLEKLFGFPNNKINIKRLETNNKIEINGSVEETKKVLEELDSQYPNWKEGFINSPLENNEISNPIKQFLIEALTNNLMLHFVILYLMIMFIIIFSCKIIIEKDIQFNFIKQYPLGNFIHNLLSKYISIWKYSANLWIYLIVFCLLIFTLASTYSLSQIITVLK